MDRLIITRFLLKRQTKLSSLRCFCDKTNGPPENAEGSIKEDENKIEQKDSAKEKINTLLKTMILESKMPRKSAGEFAKPAGIYNKPRKNTPCDDIEQKLVKAASDVAESIGEDKKKVEAVLLSKILGKINPSSSQINLDEIIGGMKIDKDSNEQGKRNSEIFTKEGTEFRNRRKSAQGDFTKQTLRAAPRSSDVLFGSKPLNIFEATKEVNYGTKVEVWDAQFEKELKLSVQRHPDNYFEKMILWTDEGKIWKFPIDNEQGLENDQKVSFTEHIFLEVHLEGWCPDAGPIRHFMELVCVGLSKNPYYTVQEKKDHINWFRDFFTAREKLLKEVGALSSGETATEKTVATDQ